MNIETFTLAEIVTIKPQAAALFEKHNLDYCCGGKRKLADVIMNNPSMLHKVTEELESLLENKVSADTDFDKLTLGQLVDHIINKHHSYVKRSLPVILMHLENVAFKHGDAFPEMKEIAVLFRKLKLDFEQHMLKEEEVLFPRIKATESFFATGEPIEENNSIQYPIHVMEAEHENAGRLMNEIKTLSNCYTAPENACMTFKAGLYELKSFEEDMHTHVHLENNILFPKALKMQEQIISGISSSCILP